MRQSLGFEDFKFLVQNLCHTQGMTNESLELGIDLIAHNEPLRNVNYILLYGFFGKIGTQLIYDYVDFIMIQLSTFEDEEQVVNFMLDNNFETEKPFKYKNSSNKLVEVFDIFEFYDAVLDLVKTIKSYDSYFQDFKTILGDDKLNDNYFFDKNILKIN